MVVVELACVARIVLYILCYVMFEVDCGWYPFPVVVEPPYHA